MIYPKLGWKYDKAGWIVRGSFEREWEGILSWRDEASPEIMEDM